MPSSITSHESSRWKPGPWPRYAAIVRGASTCSARAETRDAVRATQACQPGEPARAASPSPVTPTNEAKFGIKPLTGTCSFP